LLRTGRGLLVSVRAPRRRDVRARSARSEQLPPPRRRMGHRVSIRHERFAGMSTSPATTRRVTCGWTSHA